VPDCFSRQVFPMAVLKRAVPWWSLPLNWLVGKSFPGHVSGLSVISELITQPTLQSRLATLQAASSSQVSL
jgi:hypothetical protein